MKEGIDAKHSFEGYMQALKKSVEDASGLGAKLDDDDKNTVQNAVSVRELQ